jgi:ABC-type antimicrobial peptide transport system permease subunit
MKFLDTLKLSLHSVFNNKIRTLITIVIVFVVSLLIMVISIIGLSFYNSISAAYVNMYDINGAVFNLETYSNYREGSDSVWKPITAEEYNIVLEEFDKYPELVDNIQVDAGYIEPIYLFDYENKPAQEEANQILMDDFWGKYGDARMDNRAFSSWGDLDIRSSGINYLKSGKLWTSDDNGANKIWVSESFITAAAGYGKYLSDGDWVVFAFITYNNETNEQIMRTEKLKIGGILLDSALKEINQQSDIFLDINTLFNIMDGNMDVYSLYIINEPRVAYNFNDEYKKMSEIVNNLNERIEPSVYNNKKEERFECDLVKNLKEVRIIGAVMIGAAVFMCFIILVISIGSVANSVIISVDKNKRFLGVMMAVGLRNKGVKRIVQFEALVIITAATGIAYGILLLIKKYFTYIIDFLMTMTGFKENIVVMPVYVPLITVMAFIVMALLFARKSLLKIINMDVISVISEVA